MVHKSPTEAGGQGIRLAALLIRLSSLLSTQQGLGGACLFGVVSNRCWEIPSARHPKASHLGLEAVGQPHGNRDVLQGTVLQLGALRGWVSP